MEDSFSDIGAWTGWQVTRIFVQHCFGEELTSPLGCLCREGASVNSSKSACSVGPVVGVVVRWIGNAKSGSDGRKDVCRRPKCLVRVDFELIIQSLPRIRHRWGHGAHWSQCTRSIWWGLGLVFLRCSSLRTHK